MPSRINARPHTIVAPLLIAHSDRVKPVETLLESLLSSWQHASEEYQSSVLSARTRGRASATRTRESKRPERETECQWQRIRARAQCQCESQRTRSDRASQVESLKQCLCDRVAMLRPIAVRTAQGEYAQVFSPASGKPMQMSPCFPSNACRSRGMAERMLTATLSPK